VVKSAITRQLTGRTGLQFPGGVGRFGSAP
jgi:hypothetical protein